MGREKLLFWFRLVGVVEELELFCILFVGRASDEAEVEIKTGYRYQRFSLREGRLIILVR